MSEQTPNAEFRSDLVVTRVLNAPVQEVWRYFTEPERFSRWWGPEGFGVSKAEMDVRPGGKYLWCMSSPPEYKGAMPCNVGAFTEVVPHRRLSYTVQWANDKGKALTAAEAGMENMPDDYVDEVMFEGLPDGRTILTWKESDWPVNLEFAYSYAGMSQSLDKLERALKEGK